MPGIDASQSILYADNFIVHQSRRAQGIGKRNSLPDSTVTGARSNHSAYLGGHLNSCRKVPRYLKIEISSEVITGVTGIYIMIRIYLGMFIDTGLIEITSRYKVFHTFCTTRKVDVMWSAGRKLSKKIVYPVSVRMQNRIKAISVQFNIFIREFRLVGRTRNPGVIF